MPNAIVLVVGERFGDWEVVRLGVTINAAGQRKWVCRCKCGLEKEVAATTLKGHFSKSCLSCAQQKRWKGKRKYGAMTGHMWSRLTQSASRRGLEFSLTPEYVLSLFEKQGGKCALTGKVITLPVWNKDRYTASLDRIDNSIGYVEGNVQWVTKDVNVIRKNMTVEGFQQLCKDVYLHKRRQNKEQSNAEQAA